MYTMASGEGQDTFMATSGSDSESVSEQTSEIDSDSDTDNILFAKFPKRARPDEPDQNPQWKKTDNCPCRYGFEGAGGVQHLDSFSSPLEIFKQFFPPELTDYISIETNRYAAQNPKRPSGHSRGWSDTTQEEMSTFFAMIVVMGIMPKPDMKLYWTRHSVIETPFFPNSMPRERFMDLLANLHFTDNTQADRSDHLCKVRPVINELTNNFKTVYVPSNQITTNEALWNTNGGLEFKPKLRNSKRPKLGIKVYRVCQSTGAAAGYTWNLKIYTRQDKTNTPAKIVLDLNADLLGQGYTVLLDNWFSSPSLFRELHSRQTNIIGTVRKDRQNMPKDLRKLQLEKYELDFRSSDDGLLALVWKDKKCVRMLSTVHTVAMGDCGKRDREGNPIMKPQCVIDYNEGMKGVDCADKLALSHRVLRKSIKWYKKLFFYLLDVCLVNSYLVYKELGGTDTFVSFGMALVNQIFESRLPSLLSYRSRRRPHRLPGPDRLTGAHFPAELPSTGKRPKAFRRCIVCSSENVRKETRFMCDICQVPLCAAPCFKDYHT